MMEDAVSLGAVTLLGVLEQGRRSRLKPGQTAEPVPVGTMCLTCVSSASEML